VEWRGGMGVYRGGEGICIDEDENKRKKKRGQ
jgi:hypothetical protein